MMLLLGFILCLGIVVFVHELGHYLVARCCGVRILAFSFGFGPVLLKKTDRRGCEWRISLLPLGGYVRMLNEEERADNEEKGEKWTDADYRNAFDRKPVWQRFAVVAAGPVVNMIFAAIVYTGCSLVPTVEPATTLANPPAATQAARAGVRDGWKVLAVNGEEVTTFNQLRWQLTAHTGDQNVELLLARPDGIAKHELFDLSGFAMDDSGDRAQQLGLLMRPDAVVISQVLKDSAAQRSGLRGGDRIDAVEGERVATPQELVDRIRRAPGKNLHLTVTNLADKNTSREVVLSVPAVTENGQTVGRVGAMIGMIPELVPVQRGLIEAARAGVRNTWEILWLNLKGLKELFAGKQSLNALAGPVGIADYAGQALERGPYVFAMFLAMVSAVLGFTNLLPIPVLDGGYLAVYLWEMVTRRTVSRKAMLRAQKVGLVLLLLIFVVATGNDLTRLFGLH